ncbi:translational machinery component [Xylariaceae sp. FL0662B]|nr:translational machinery component [Xylariaceae sp. FL0662B]
MNPSSSRLLATTRSQISLSHPVALTRQWVRPFSQTCLRQADSDRPTSLLDRLPRPAQPSQPTGPPRPNTSGNTNAMSQIQRILTQDTLARARNQPTTAERAGLGRGEDGRPADWGPATEPFHLHIFAHKHNTHVTATLPNRKAIVSLSCGNIGFRKTKRGSYDAAYQLAAYAMDKLNQGGWHKKIDTLEVVLRGFGPGREAATKVLLGNEGRLIRPKIVKVSDSTRIKFGGTRSKKPRRLG